MSKLDKFKDSVAVITGAGSGIGRALAMNLASVGANVAISDVNRNSVEETAALLEGSGVKVHVATLDVTQRDKVLAYAEEVETYFGHVNLVINNAGAALNGEFAKVSIDDIEWQMGVNFNGVMYGTKAFLPILERAEWGHIVNISSLFGLIASPFNSAYNASKFAVRGMTECLRIELDMAGSSVSCTCVHPGGVKTNIARFGRSGQSNTFGGGKSHQEIVDGFDKVARTTPEKAAEIILTGAAKNKKRVLVGFDAWLIDKVQRLLPTRYFFVMRRVFGFGLD